MEDYLRHEALDRTSMLCDMIDNYLLQHEYVMGDADLLVKVTSAQSILCEVYQEIGRQHMAPPPPLPKEPA